ncbi:hypothetical protein [Pleurocapsa sp. CCALA 161]|nr:hypothetical protein [Pleurocapsa sp. CCALA 161]
MLKNVPIFRYRSKQNVLYSTDWQRGDRAPLDSHSKSSHVEQKIKDAAR